MSFSQSQVFTLTESAWAAVLGMGDRAPAHVQKALIASFQGAYNNALPDFVARVIQLNGPVPPPLLSADGVWGRKSANAAFYMLWLSGTTPSASSCRKDLLTVANAAMNDTPAKVANNITALRGQVNCVSAGAPTDWAARARQRVLAAAQGTTYGEALWNIDSYAQSVGVEDTSSRTNSVATATTTTTTTGPAPTATGTSVSNAFFLALQAASQVPNGYPVTVPGSSTAAPQDVIQGEAIDVTAPVHRPSPYRVPLILGSTVVAGIFGVWVFKRWTKRGRG